MSERPTFVVSSVTEHENGNKTATLLRASHLVDAPKCVFPLGQITITAGDVTSSAMLKLGFEFVIDIQPVIAGG